MQPSLHPVCRSHHGPKGRPPGRPTLSGVPEAGCPSSTMLLSTGRFSSVPGRPSVRATETDRHLAPSGAAACRASRTFWPTNHENSPLCPTGPAPHPHCGQAAGAHPPVDAPWPTSQRRRSTVRTAGPSSLHTGSGGPQSHASKPKAVREARFGGERVSAPAQIPRRAPESRRMPVLT